MGTVARDAEILYGLRGQVVETVRDRGELIVSTVGGGARWCRGLSADRCGRQMKSDEVRMSQVKGSGAVLPRRSWGLRKKRSVTVGFSRSRG
jgi:hypothetical protein